MVVALQILQADAEITKLLKLPNGCLVKLTSEFKESEMLTLWSLPGNRCRFCPSIGFPEVLEFPHRPDQTGGRFSTNARAPSAASAVLLIFSNSRVSLFHVESSQDD